MKKVILFAAALALVASSAFASGLALSINACPGNAGAVANDGGVVDCAGGAGLIILGTFAPAEPITDLAALDGTLDAIVSGGDMTTNGFWNWDGNTGCNAAALASSQARPSAGCATPVVYTATWSPAGSGTAIGAFNSGPQTEHLVFTCFRPSVLNVAANQRLFGVQITVDGSTATEAGGSCAGCPAPFCIVWNSGIPRSNGASTPSELTGPDVVTFSGASNQLAFNGGSGSCFVVPTKKHTWGQLKSLYR